LLKEVSFDWSSLLDAVVDITPEIAYLTSLKLIRKGLIVGPSSGLTYAGLLKHLSEKSVRKNLKENLDRDINIVFTCCDTPFVHIDNYFHFIDAKEFPNVINITCWKKRSECTVCSQHT